MNERILELLIRAKNTAGPGIASAQKALTGFSRKVKAGLRGIRTVAKNVTTAFRQNWLMVVAAVFLVQKALRGVINLVKEIGLSAAIEVENLRTRLQAVLGTVKEGNKVFKDMARLAGEVPKTYQEIMNAATDLAGVVREGSTEVAKFMPMIIDISSATGIAVREATSQIIRMYSAGAAAADMFRERGISAALGFQAGASISAKETMRVMVEQWEDGTGKFVGAAELLKSTWIGITSMLQDKWFNFKVLVGEAGFFDVVKADLAALNDTLQRFIDSGDYEEWAERVSRVFSELYEGAKRFVVLTIIGTAQMVDGWNNLTAAVNAATIGVMTVVIGYQKLVILSARAFDRANISAYLDNLKNMEGILTALIEQQGELNEKASTDFSDKTGTAIQEFIDNLERTREKLEETGFAEKAAEAEAAIAKMREEFAKTGDTAKEVGETFDSIMEKSITAAANLGAASARLIVTQVNTLSQGIGKAFSDMVMKGTNFGESMKAVFVSMASMFIQQITAMIVKWAVMQTIGQAMAAGAMALASGMASALTAMWAVPATLASIATAGGAAATGSAAVIGAIATGKAAAIASQSIPGFAEGTDSIPANVSPGEMIVPRSFASAIRAGDLTIGGPGGGGNKEVNVTIENAYFTTEENAEETFNDLLFLIDEEERSRV